MIHIALQGFFTTSVLSVRENAVKNVIFRAATLLLQLFIVNMFAFIAARSNAYTSYLMFAENFIQKFFYVTSRNFNRHALLLLAFVALGALSGLYDTLLWALDSPGYVVRSKTTNAASLSQDIVINPAYITYVSNPTGNVNDIDAEGSIAANLFKSGLNFTLPGVTEPGVREIVSSSQSIDNTGPRIWLDEDGLSVSVDQSVMVTTDAICPLQTLTNTTQGWKCIFNNTDALQLVQTSTGNPEIFWDDQRSEYLLPNRMDNPWKSLGSGGDTAVMKQVFTVTKDRRRHTFIETAFKASMLSLYPAQFNDNEITDLIHRTWSSDPTQPITPDIQALADYAIDAQANQSTASFGVFVQEPYASLSSTIELLNVINSANAIPLYSLFRITSTNITLIRSETLPQGPTPLYCRYDTVFSTNLATGGQLRGNTCYKSVDQTKASFVSQLDASAVVVINSLLGDGTSDSSAVAFNQTGWDWFMSKSNYIDDLLTSRGLIAGGDRAAVQVAVQHNEAAISYLQLLLTLLPALLFLIGTVVIFFSGPMSYYQSSFLAAVCTTTHMTPGECQKVRYLRDPPEITLQRRGTHVLLGTPGGGTLANVGGNQNVQPYGMKPLMNKDES
ncbi:hypothetical protein K443DRAFT_94105 [Laccaria amethystina LaAM-08-1]|uniref:Unplaced genomic scaffold K443scaffold_39, whole genome shotgun sequence n=1 Tax=Laccaria amethystina LaAM-08-1 TaxID=1095629 RepID=A0A0C9Y1W1_9AGAR|nr:hypothetical protein K443DRAFT_94105 [Laccaria amethystina LaAM-08-1]